MDGESGGPRQSRCSSTPSSYCPRTPSPGRCVPNSGYSRARGREGHAIALQGLALVGSNRDLWKLVSESYVAKGDYDAAIRARWASFGVSDQDSEDWRRMSELMELAGRSQKAEAASQRADVLAGQEDLASGGVAPASGRQR